MANNNNNATMKTNKNKNYNHTRCAQINLQHSRLATDNVMKVIEKKGIEIVLIQEPYTIRNRIAGIPRGYRTYTFGEGRSRAAILITNNQLAAIQIVQLSDEDTVVIETTIGNHKYILISMYLDINEQLERDIGKIDRIITFSKGAKYF